MKAKIYVKPWRTCSNNTECTAMSPETHTIQTTHFHRMIHYQRIRSQRWLVPPPGLPQDASRASEGLEDISTIYTPWPKFGQISGSGDIRTKIRSGAGGLNARVSHGSSCFPWPPKNLTPQPKHKQIRTLYLQKPPNEPQRTSTNLRLQRLSQWRIKCQRSGTIRLSVFHINWRSTSRTLNA